MRELFETHKIEIAADYVKQLDLQNLEMDFIKGKSDVAPDFPTGAKGKNLKKPDEKNPFTLTRDDF